MHATRDHEMRFCCWVLLRTLMGPFVIEMGELLMKLLPVASITRARSTHTVLLGFVLLAMLTSVASSAPPSTWESKECASARQPCAPGGRKFFPGFYAGMGGNAGTPADLSIISGRKEYVGIVRYYYWRDLEPAFGNYDFSRIDADKAVAAADGRKLGIYFRMAMVTPGGNPATPNYMWNDSSYGGVIAGAYGNYLGASGHNIWKPMIWNTKVKNRIYAMLDALAKHYNNDSDIAFIIFPEETTEGATTADDPNYTCNTNIQALKDIFTHAWSVLPNTPTLMELDWACTDIPTALHQFIVDGGHGAWTINAVPCQPERDQNSYSLYRTHYNDIAALINLDGWNDVNMWPCNYSAAQILAELGPGKLMQPRYFLADLTNSTTRSEIIQAVNAWWTQNGKVWPLSQRPIGWN
jgi:hypothetical protein